MKGPTNKTMQIKIGCHVSIAGGIFNAPKNAFELGCETFQIFSRSPQGGPAPRLTGEVVQKFRESMARYHFTEFVIHAPYYINFGSPKPETLAASIRVVREEMERGSLLGAKYVMLHPGSVNGNLEAGFVQAQQGLKKVLAGYTGSTQLLIEIPAGAGQVIGDTFEELAAMVETLKNLHGFGGICYDTQHAFASGYDIRSSKIAEETMKQFDEVIGLGWLRMSHVNDSKVDLGAKKDRHEHIGAGYIGREGFGYFLSALQALSARLKTEIFSLILETEHDKVKADIEILKGLR